MPEASLDRLINCEAYTESGRDGETPCHTALVEGYVVEGHVPVGAIVRFLEDRPEGIGLALPGMPADAAGMTDDSASFETQPVMLIGNDGTLTPYDY